MRRWTSQTARSTFDAPPKLAAGSVTPFQFRVAGSSSPAIFISSGC
jgi:hypothetical protein